MSVETIRDIPVIVEHRKGCKGDFEPMDFDNNNYAPGFPFDNSGRRSRDPFEDIAQRHPEFAQHLQGFPRRPQRNGGEQDEDEFLRRRFERPFSSGRFERFGFPFNRDDFEREPQRYYEAYPEYFETFQNQHPQSPSHNQSQPQQQSSSSQTPQGYQQYPPQYSQEYQPQYNQNSQENQQSSQHPPQYQSQPSQSVSQGTQTEDCQSEEPQEQQQQQPPVNESQEQKAESGQTRGRPIQQSNTCDLAQHQPADEALNERGQRSMSAPPENKRFTSSVNIPMGGSQENNAPSAGGAKSQAGSGSTERVIPIHVEGRDDPVMPKSFSGPPPTQTHHQQPQPERIFTDGPRSPPETIFGRRPEAFTQFVHRDPHRFPNDWHHHSFGGFPEEEFGFRQTESPTRFTGAKPQPQQHQQEQPHRQEAATHVHRQKTQPQEQKPDNQPEAAPHPPPPKQPLGPIEQIQAIQKDVSTLLRQVEAFSGIPRDKNYLYLDEMLTRNLLKLDNVDTQGQDSIRSARKEAIKCIEKAIGVLEAKAAANVANKQQTMEVEQTQPPQDGEKMETEVNPSQEPNTMEMSPPASQNEAAMEVAAGSEDSNNKSDETPKSEQQSKSAEIVESTEEQANKTEEMKSEEPSKATEEKAAQPQPNEEAQKEAPKEGGEQPKVEVKEGEKKEKKKIKKKVNKEDKEKKQ